MQHLKNPLLLAGVMLLLSACGATFDYDSLASKKITGTRFADHLARAYQSFALSEAYDMKKRGESFQIWGVAKKTN